jgi:hypothetical protein
VTCDPSAVVAETEPAIRLITVSASYGAGGSVVAPALAERLGLPFLQRVTTSEGHPAAPGPCDEQLTEEEMKATPVHRLLASLIQAMPVGPTQSRPLSDNGTMVGVKEPIRASLTPLAVPMSLAGRWSRSACNGLSAAGELVALAALQCGLCRLSS